jgi:hypothetical protein
VRRLARGLSALAVLLLAAARAGAQSLPPPDLYEQALQSIAEGRNTDASATLARAIEREPLHAGAWLELALLQCALGHADEAERLFKAIEQRFEPPPGIVEVITRTRAAGCDAWQAHSQASLVAARGIDQNVNQGASNPSYTVVQEGKPAEVLLTEEFLPHHDQYSVAGAEYRRDLTPNGTAGFVQLQARRNDHLHQYDSASLFGGVDSTWRFGRWTLGATATLGAVRFGGQLFQRQAQLQARVGPPLALPFKAQFQLLGGVTRVRYLTLTSFDSTTAELKGQLLVRGAGSLGSASAGVQEDHASGARPGGDRHGWVVSLLGRTALRPRLNGELGYTHQGWNSVEAYAPGLIDVARRQRTQVTRAALSWTLDRNSSLQLEGRWIRNGENISIFQYNNRLLQLAWQWNGW